MAENYFDQIKLIWEKLGVPNKIIPFCTPLKKNPKFLIRVWWPTRMKVNVT